MILYNHVSFFVSASPNQQLDEMILALPVAVVSLQGKLCRVVQQDLVTDADHAIGSCSHFHIYQRLPARHRLRYLPCTYFGAYLNA